MQENRRKKNIIMQTEERAVERETEKTEWRSLWSENGLDVLGIKRMLLV